MHEENGKNVVTEHKEDMPRHSSTTTNSIVYHRPPHLDDDDHDRRDGDHLRESSSACSLPPPAFHPSTSSPILYRAVASCSCEATGALVSSSSSCQQRTPPVVASSLLPSSTALLVSQEPPTTAVVTNGRTNQQGFLQGGGGPIWQKSHHVTTSSKSSEDSFPNCNNSHDLVDNGHDCYTSSSEGSSYEGSMDDDDDDDYDGDDDDHETDYDGDDHPATFEKYACDIEEDRVTVAELHSNLHTASFSTTSCRKLNSSHPTTPTREVIAISSGSDDFKQVEAAPHQQQQQHHTNMYSEFAMRSKSSFRSWKRNKRSSTTTTTTATKKNNSSSESSSLMTLSSVSSSTGWTPRKRSLLRPSSSRNISCIISLLARVLLALWILFIYYYCHHLNHNTSFAIFPIMGELHFMSEKMTSIHGNHHIPLPPPDHKVSVVLMNHPTSSNHYLKESQLLPMLLQHSSVEEVVILHFNPKEKFNVLHPKVINIDAVKEKDKMGLSVKFYFCQMAKNDWVVHVDDNLVFSEKTLNEMLFEFSKNTKRIVGRYGRDRKENNHFNGYSSKDTSKETEVVLSKFMVMERYTCSNFFQYSHLIWEDIVLNDGEGPLWNGEDIFMSLVSNHVHGHDGDKNNYAMDWLEVKSYPKKFNKYANMKFDIMLGGGFLGIDFLDFNWWMGLLRKNRHYSYLGKLWREAKQRLENSGPHKPYIEKE